MQSLIIIPKDELVSILQEVLKNSISHQLQGQEQSDRILMIEEAARFLGLAPQTIYGFTHQNKIPFYKKGKKLYFRESDLIAWLEKGRNKTQDEIAEEAQQITFKRKGGRNA